MLQTEALLVLEASPCQRRGNSTNKCFASCSGPHDYLRNLGLIQVWSLMKYPIMVGMFVWRAGAGQHCDILLRSQQSADSRSLVTAPSTSTSWPHTNTSTLCGKLNKQRRRLMLMYCLNRSLKKTENASKQHLSIHSAYCQA